MRQSLPLEVRRLSVVTWVWAPAAVVAYWIWQEPRGVWTDGPFWSFMAAYLGALLAVTVSLAAKNLAPAAAKRAVFLVVLPAGLVLGLPALGAWPRLWAIPTAMALSGVSQWIVARLGTGQGPRLTWLVGLAAGGPFGFGAMALVAEPAVVVNVGLLLAIYGGATFRAWERWSHWAQRQAEAPAVGS